MFYPLAYYRDHYRDPLHPGMIERATRQLCDGTPVEMPPDPADPLADGIPPWTFEADHIVLGVPVEEVAPHVRQPIEPVARDGKTELFVGFNHIPTFETSDPQPKWVPPYDEIMVSTRVQHPNGSEGSFYLKLHLDQRIPIDMGVAHFGYPKERAHIQRYERTGRIRYRAQRVRQPGASKPLRLERRAARRTRRAPDRSRARGSLPTGSDGARPGAKRAFFQHGRELLQTNWVATPTAPALRFLKVKRADFAFITGVLEIRSLRDPEVATRPKLAMHSRISTGYSDEPQPIPARAPPSELLRLASVKLTKPLMDEIFGWLSR